MVAFPQEASQVIWPHADLGGVGEEGLMNHPGSADLLAVWRTRKPHCNVRCSSQIKSCRRKLR